MNRRVALPNKRFTCRMHTFTIFFSWQSDSDKENNQRAIRKALQKAITAFEERNEKWKLELQEATSNMPGSEYIPGAIVRKIYNSDMFVGDITTINPTSVSRKVPNPNVLVELGHAVAVLGWNRIMLLANTASTLVPDDIPFDIDRHRVSTYRKNNKADSAGQKALDEVVFRAIQQILKADPPRPDWSKKIKAQTYRAHDTKILTTLLSQLHIPSVELFLARAPETIDTRILSFREGFTEIVRQASFYLYDKKAFRLCNRLADAWQNSIRFSGSYWPTKSDHTVRFGSDPWPLEQDPAKREEQQTEFDRLKEREHKEWKKLVKSVDEFRGIFGKFHQYIKQHYQEINLEQTNTAAWQRLLEDEG